MVGGEFAKRDMVSLVPLGMEFSDKDETMHVLLSDSSADVQTGRDRRRREQHCHMKKGRKKW